MESTICNGIPVYYKTVPARSASPSPFTIVLLHNAGTDHTIWSAVTEILSEKHPIIQVDWPGYGKHRTELQQHGLADYADILSIFIKENKLTSVVLVGNCLGSGAALEYCTRVKGEGIHAMVLFNVLLPRTLGLMGRFFYHWANSPLNILYNGVRKTLYTPKPLASVAVKYQIEKPTLVPNEAINHLKELNTKPENIQNLGLLVESLYKSNHLDNIKMADYFPKTMIVWGEKNRVLPWKKGKSFVNDFGPTEHAVINGGHLVMLEKAKESAAKILKTVQHIDLS